MNDLQCMRILDERINYSIINLDLRGDIALEDVLLQFCLFLVELLEPDICIRAGFHIREGASEWQCIGWSRSKLLEGGEEVKEWWSYKDVSICVVSNDEKRIHEVFSVWSLGSLKSSATSLGTLVSVHARYACASASSKFSSSNLCFML